MDWFKTKINQIKNERSNNLKSVHQIRAVIIGAGKRSKTYSQYAKEFPDQLLIVGVAEQCEDVRLSMKNSFNLEDKYCFTNCESLCKVDKFADCAIICTPEPDHVEPAVKCAKKGYHILLGSPIAVTAEECKTIYQTSIENSVKVSACNVLRHHPSVKKLKEFIDSDVIGDIVNVSLVAPVGYWHFAHSCVRGNWANQDRSTFSLLSNGYHDVDLIYFLMSKVKCKKISSFGSLFHFRSENKPANAGERCLQCDAEPKCPFSAQKIYLNPEPDSPRFPMSSVCDIEESDEGYMFHLKQALETGSYGKCVYELDNAVCDNQVVNFQFDNGATANLTMVALSNEACGRKAVISGTRGQLQWDDAIQHFDFLTDTTTTIECEKENEEWAHGGSDFIAIKTFVEALLSKKEENFDSTELENYLNSHLLFFAAEQSRLTGQVVDLDNGSTSTV